MTERTSTLPQRMAVENMYKALGKSTMGIRDMTFNQASKAIDDCKKEIAKKGFPKPRVDGDGLSDDPAEW